MPMPDPSSPTKSAINVKTSAVAPTVPLPAKSANRPHRKPVMLPQAAPE